MNAANTARRGRGRPRKQDLSAREPCDAPVIELTSSSDEDEPPRPPVRKPQAKPSPKPPILVKRSMTPRPAARIVSTLVGDKEKTKTLTDTEALLSILESNADDLEGISVMAEKKTESPGAEKLSEKKDNLFKSIEDELRSLHQLDDENTGGAKDDAQLNPSKPGKISEKRSSVEIIDEVKSDVRKVRESSEIRTGHLKSLLADISSDVVVRRVKSDKKVLGSKVSGSDEAKKGDVEVTKIHRFDSSSSKSPSQLKLPPEVLQAIKKRANLGRIEKIVEKTDSNKKSKYIVIFNKGASAPKKKSSIEEEIEELLKSLPEKPPAKKLKMPERKETISSKTKYYKPSDFSAVKTRFTKVFDPKDRKNQSYKVSDFVSKYKMGSNESQKSSTFKSLLSKSMDVYQPDAVKSPPRPEEPVRFTESPLSHEPSLPWNGGNDEGFEKYFKITEKVVENHDSLDSESEYEEPEMLSHFKNLDKDHATTEEKDRANDAISVTNIADTIAREFPGWSAESVPGSDTICLVRLGLDGRGLMKFKKQIKIDSDYNVSVFVNNISIPEYEGLYDTFDNIKQLVREIDQL